MNFIKKHDKIAMALFLTVLSLLIFPNFALFVGLALFTIVITLLFGQRNNKKDLG